MRSAAASALDVYPTLASLGRASVPFGHALDGVDLVPVLTQKAHMDERALFWGYADSRAVRMGDWRLVLNRNGDNKGLFLFNLREDPLESQNLRYAEPGRTSALLSALRVWEKQTTATRPSSLQRACGLSC